MSEMGCYANYTRTAIDACCRKGHRRYILRLMGMRVYISLPLLLAFPSIVRAQTNGRSPVVSEASAQGLASTSAIPLAVVVGGMGWHDCIFLGLSLLGVFGLAYRWSGG